MGKRKRRADRNNTAPSPAFVSHSHTSQMETSLKEKSSHSVGSTGAKSTSSSFKNNMEKSPHGHHQSAANHRHHNVNRQLSSKVPRHYYNLQHSQQKGANYSGTSTSHGKSSVRDDKHSWKFGHRPDSGFGYHAGRRDKGSRRVDRIRSNTMMITAISPNVMNIDCGLCRQRMNDNSVVAVLVCGHFYHVDCLETRTCNEDRRDPPCPLCIPSGVDN
ncbi:hypothetical protein L2E82_39161 [Cichorium intybus]|uniref:Uncharacterized protein n=1 Tax=Cichorium intybus TaxID=13427 RepID=A0ACB9AH84_CICIN|nr:hypothetical protein L2E82_39161 [Cichorium intybus]